MPDEGTMLGLAIGFCLLAVAFVFGPGWIGLGCGFFGGLILMMSGLTYFLETATIKRGG